MTRSSNTRICTPFANPERQFRARKDTTPISVHNIYSFYESKSSDAESREIGEVDIETLTMEQYLALDHRDTSRGIRRPEIGRNVDFEIRGQFLRELKDNIFSWNENEDAHEHVGRILEIPSLFNTLGVSRDAIMLRIFILRFCPPSKTSTQLEEIHNLRHEEGLGSPKPISMVIEISDRSMQSPKGIVENVLVKIDKFNFLVDFLILDIMEDNKVLIILGRPMLATAYARIDVFGRKISLEVGTEKVPDDFGGPENLEEAFSDFDNEMGIGLDYFGEGIEDLWDAQDPVITPNKEIEMPLRPQFFGIVNRIHQQNPYNLQIKCKIGVVNFNPYIDPNSPVNVMFRACSNKVESRMFLHRKQFCWGDWNGYSRKGTKRKPKANKSKHGVERAKSKVKPSKENTT
ncbi:la-related protein 1B-like protein [Tanacetum coccineum]